MRLSINILVTALLTLSTLSAWAQKEKVVEQSDKKRPEWIGCSTSSTIAITETGKTLAEVQEKALASIRQNIINSVAVNITSTEEMTSRQVSKDNLYSVMHDYTSTLMTEAAKLPFMSNISLSNAKDIYWEKIYSKADKTYRYEYSVCYPFDEIERRNLVREFLAIDNKKVAELEALRREAETLTDLDRIPRALNALEELHAYFFDEVRRNETQEVMKNFRGLYKQVSIEVEEEQAGECIYSLRISGRRVVTSIPVRLKSDSALDMAVKAIDNERYMLSYDASYASPRDINSIEISYPMGAVKVSRTITFEAPKN